MKMTIKLLIATCTCFLVVFSKISAQGNNQPLTMQGLNYSTNASAASRAMGGVTLNMKNDIGVMFSNPSELQTLEGIQVSVGGMLQYKTNEQSQNWVPLKNYTNFSILIDGTSKNLPPLVIDTVKTKTPNAGDTLWRSLDGITPAWSHTKNQTFPIQASIAVPFSFREMKCVIGFGVLEYANLNYYYQNNNVLSQDLGLTPAPSNDSAYSALPIYWNQHLRARDGSIYGYGGAFSISMNDNIALGISARWLKGSTADNEAMIGRGRLTFYKDYFRLDPYRYDTLKSGTSNYSGQEYSLSGIYNGKNITFGITIKPAMTITREYSSTVTINSSGIGLSSSFVKGTDKIKLPWRGTIGIGLLLRPEISVSLEYEYSPYSTAAYVQGNATSFPWLDASFVKFGIQYMPASWLALRGGYHKQNEVFQPSGYAIDGSPVSSDVFSTGIGVNLLNIRLNIAYEYIKVQYEDTWLTNSNINKEIRQNIVADMTYILPW